MIIDLATATGAPIEYHRSQTGTQFAAVMAQYTATPLFAPWPVVIQDARTNPAEGNAELNTHPTASNRREGRHARG